MTFPPTYFPGNGAKLSSNIQGGYSSAAQVLGAQHGNDFKSSLSVINGSYKSNRKFHI